MTRDVLHGRNRQNMDKWLLKLRESHAVATVLLGFGVDRAQGQGVICALEKISTDDLIVILKETLRLLEGAKPGDTLYVAKRPPIG